jgi:hypothetical protein
MVKSSIRILGCVLVLFFGAPISTLVGALLVAEFLGFGEEFVDKRKA